ncbi:hypothetical protein F5Y03DRAFT_125745 [Xylaria venustula]|nr:hypothetical protein F5Y03DRAFT_125745 [Xylaria venustula]
MPRTSTRCVWTRRRLDARLLALYCLVRSLCRDWQTAAGRCGLIAEALFFTVRARSTLYPSRPSINCSIDAEPIGPCTMLRTGGAAQYRIVFDREGISAHRLLRPVRLQLKSLNNVKRGP